jgi:metal-responsive CopG/Arc/MetJ family transcriptional regulator
MKAKTSITLSRDVLVQLDRMAGSKYSRSAMIEQVLREYLKERARAAIAARDLERINAAADELTAEALDALEYQAPDDDRD